MDRPLTLAIPVVAAAGALAVWAIGRYNLGAYPWVAMVLGYGSPLVFVLLGYWIARSREHGDQALPRGARRAMYAWFLVAWGCVVLVALVRELGVPAVGSRTLYAVFLALLGASLVWVAYRYYCYRFARLTWRRATLVGLLVGLLGIMLYPAYWSNGGWSQFARFFWFIVVVAIFAVLRRRDAGRGDA